MFQLNVKKMQGSWKIAQSFPYWPYWTLYVRPSSPERFSPCITESFRGDGLKYNVQYGQYEQD